MAFSGESSALDASCPQTLRRKMGTFLVDLLRSVVYTESDAGAPAALDNHGGIA